MPVKSSPIQEAEAFNDLFNRTHLTIYRFIYALHGGPVEEVEDLACDTYFRAWKARSGFSGDEHDALCWLFTIARHLVIDTQRRKKGHPDSSVIDIDDQEVQAMFSGSEITPEEQAARREQFIHLWKILHQLSDDKREVLVLRYILGWKVKEIAVFFKKEENTISVYIRRCLAEIRSRWSEE